MKIGHKRQKLSNSKKLVCLVQICLIPRLNRMVNKRCGGRNFLLAQRSCFLALPQYSTKILRWKSLNVQPKRVNKRLLAFSVMRFGTGSRLYNGLLTSQIMTIWAAANWEDSMATMLVCSMETMAGNWQITVGKSFTCILRSTLKAQKLKNKSFRR